MNIRVRRDIPPFYLNMAFIVAAIAVLYAPTMYDMFTYLWLKPEQMHGPLIFAISIWLMIRKWPEMVAKSSTDTGASGWVVLTLAFLLYFVGRTQNIIVFELGSMIFFLSGLILLNHGVQSLKVHWFALFFMFFMIPLPSVIVDTLTMPMKLLVSFSVENVLLMFDYPVARKGVVIQVGPYMLLVADACAGLHTLFSLEALGLLYLNLVRRNSLFRNTTLALLIIPISLVSNILRVLFLTLITYHFGDAAGQSYLHYVAGIVLFVSALVLIVGLDGLIHSIERKRQDRGYP